MTRLATACCLLAACQSAAPALKSPAPTGKSVPAQIQFAVLNPAATCEGSFTTHTLDFSNGTRMRELRTYASNGAGLAVNDLDDDGDLDLVFARIDGNSAILWNEGQLKFTKQELADVNTRAASSVDVDGDGRLDLVFSHRTGGVSYWRNLGDRQFAQAELPHVDAFAYSLAWADLNGDGALDLVTGSYKAELEREGVDPAAIKDRSGVFYYEHTQAGFTPHRLAPTAQALSIGLVDVDGDGHTDIWVANDFVEQDNLWLHHGEQWDAAKPFPITSYNTMSIDWADLRNDGSLALFTTDMTPYDISVENMARWLPMTAATQQYHEWGDPQINQNVLLVRDAKGAWANEAPASSIDATGWSWAGRFGDLDNDGHLDLYVVNGMIAKDLFGHLPNDELIEENRAFHNRGDGAFELANAWHLNATTSGRGMAMADLDNDGDLDIAVNNLRASAQVFENRLCAGNGLSGNNLQVNLRWVNAANSHAIGAWVELHTDQGMLRRDVRATSGYLTGDASRVHFGVPATATPQFLQILWPDGATTRLDLQAKDLNQIATVTR